MMYLKVVKLVYYGLSYSFVHENYKHIGTNEIYLIKKYDEREV